MYRLFKISVFILLSQVAAAQCDTTGILLELQATTNLQGLLIGDDRCIKKAVVMSPLVLSNDTLSVTGGGSGTVTSFSSGGLSPLFTTSVATATTTPALSFAQVTQSANTFYAGPTSGGAANPTFRLLTTGDITGLLVANNGVSDNEAGGVYRLGNRYMNTPDAPFTMDRKVNIAGFMFHIGDNTDSTLLTIDGVNDRVGIGTASPQRKLHVNGNARVSNLNPGVTSTVLVAADANGDFQQVSASTGLSLVANVLTSTITQYTDENAQDAVGTILTDGSIIDFTYNDATPSIAATVIAGSIGTTQLTDDGVTYAKLQNISTNNRILGRITAGPGNAEELTAANMQTILAYLDGALTNPRIPYASDANTLTDNANLVWLNATQEIMIGGGASLDARFSHKATANITGDSKFSNGDNNVSGTYEMRLANTRNVSNTGNSKLTLQTGGTAAGDPFIYLNVPGGGSISIGIDNTDGDKVKFSPLATTPGLNANNGLIITTTATPLIGINKDAPAHPLDVTGKTRADQYVEPSVAWGSGDVFFGTGAGTSPTFTSMTGSHNRVRIKFSTGTAPAANNNVFAVVRKTGFEFASVGWPVLSAGNAQTATDISKFYVGGDNGVTWNVIANGTLSASTAYELIVCFSGN